MKYIQVEFELQEMEQTWRDVVAVDIACCIKEQVVVDSFHVDKNYHPENTKHDSEIN